MNEEKIPKEVWWVGAAVAAVLAIGHLLFKRSSKVKAKVATSKIGMGDDSVRAPNRVSASLYKQFNLPLGQVARIESEGLEIEFSDIRDHRLKVAGDSSASDSPVEVEFKMTQTIGDVCESSTFVITGTRFEGRTNEVKTGDALISSYHLKLLKVMPEPALCKNIKKSEYVVNLVVFKD